MTILLIEDEPLIARQLLKLVHQLEPGAIIDGPIMSVEGICAYYKTRVSAEYPDLVIADIQLSDGISFEAFGKINLNTPVIFTTAYDEYAIKAFKLNSLDYLLKPIDPNELKAALQKYHRWASHEPSHFNEQFKQFLHQFTNPSSIPQYKRRFVGQHIRQIMSVSQEQVAYFLRNELIYLYTTEGKKLITDYKTLDELEELVDPTRFFRANRQCLLSLEVIAGYQHQEGQKLRVLLKSPIDKIDVIISKEKSTAFRHWLED